jgi:hypothetical protein
MRMKTVMALRRKGEREREREKMLMVAVIFQEVVY